MNANILKYEIREPAYSITFFVGLAVLSICIKGTKKIGKES